MDEQAPEEPEPNHTGVADQLQRTGMKLIDPHLAIADDAIAEKLEAGQVKISDAHAGIVTALMRSETMRILRETP